MKPKFILIGGNGYYGRNYQYFLSSKGIEYVVIDKVSCSMPPDEIICDFAKNEHFNKLIKSEPIENLKDKIFAVINFAAISFVDYSIEHPEETIENNYNCCVNGWKLCQELNCPKYVYISTDEVNVDKEEKYLSPYVISKRKCEEFLLNLDSKIETLILRPVNLMGTVEPHFEPLVQKNPCLLKKIADVINKKNNVPKIQIHGSGNQRRMFMEMKIACEVLHLFIFNGFDATILDITEYPEFRTQNLRIKDIVLYLSRKYGFAYEHVQDPRGVYQDDNYLTGLNLREYNGSMKKIVNSMKCFILE
jgi:nucleoside-diphosphate-sugar epimerase